MKYYIIFFCVSCSLFLTYCDTNEEKDFSPEQALLHKGLEGAGGMENWKNLDSIQFYKTTKLYLADGTVEDSTYQLHTYYMHPDMNGKYSWKMNGEKMEVRFEDGQASKYINGLKVELDEKEEDKLRLGFLGAQFVMCLPFKLNDPGVQLSIDGKSIINEKNVDVLKASYNTSNDNHTKSHDWWHYINSESGELEGYKVHHPPTFAQVINVKTTTLKGIKFPVYRRTYRVDENDNREYLRGEFWYEYIENH